MFVNFHTKLPVVQVVTMVTWRKNMIHNSIFNPSTTPIDNRKYDSWSKYSPQLHSSQRNGSTFTSHPPKSFVDKRYMLPIDSYNV